MLLGRRVESVRFETLQPTLQPTEAPVNTGKRNAPRAKGSTPLARTGGILACLLSGNKGMKTRWKQVYY